MKCPNCGAQSASGVLCDECAGLLVSVLRALPGLIADLDVSMSRQSRYTRGGNRRGGETPLMFEPRAADVAWTVRNTLQTWVRDLALGDLPTVDDPAVWCAWLLARVERVRIHVASAEILDELTFCRDEARRVIDRPADRVYCGACEVCEQEVYAKADEGTATCWKCKTVIDVVARRDRMLRRMSGELATVAKCAQVLGMFGMPVRVDTIQNWARPRERNGVMLRPKLEARGVNSAGHKVYRIADVEALARAAVARQGKTA